MNWEDWDALAKSKWYHLLTCWNASDKQVDKEKTDVYRLKQYFGKYANTEAITKMLGSTNTHYWIWTKHEKKDHAYVMHLNMSGCTLTNFKTTGSLDVCGRKDME